MIRHSTVTIDKLLMEIFLWAHPSALRKEVLDLDLTDTPLHGNQEAVFSTATTSTRTCLRNTSKPF